MKIQADQEKGEGLLIYAESSTLETVSVAEFGDFPQLYWTANVNQSDKYPYKNC